MLVKALNDCPVIVANDGCRLRELLHPDNDAVELPFSLAIAELSVGAQSYRHFLRQSELYYILAGCGTVHAGGERRDVAAGDVVLIPPNVVQWVENTGNKVLQFAAIVSPPWREDDDVRV